MDPLDDLNVQLPGRLMAVEIVMVLLLRELPKKKRTGLFTLADHILSTLEADIHAQGLGQTDDYALKSFAAARENLGMMRSQSLAAD
jgi:hypothetical protein